MNFVVELLELELLSWIYLNSSCLELFELELLSWIDQNSSGLKVPILPHSDKGSALKCANQRYLSSCQKHLKPNAFP